MKKCLKLLVLLLVGVLFLFQKTNAAAELTTEQRIRLEQIEQKLLDFEAKIRRHRIEKQPLLLEREYCKELTVDEIRFLSDLTIEALKQDDFLLQKELTKISRFFVVGDLHGDLNATVAYVAEARAKNCPVLFLGDYIDRGFHSYETIAYLYTQKALFPEQTFLLRGNHDYCVMTPQFRTLFGELTSKRKGDYTVNYIHADLCRVMDYLPLAAILFSSESKEKIFCVHGGIVPHLDLDQLRTVERPFYLTPSSPYFQMVWTDLDDSNPIAFHPNPMRQGGLAFSKQAVDEFFARYGFTKILRGHQKLDQFNEALPTPYQHYPDGSVTTIHSAVDYLKEKEPGDCAIICGKDMHFEFLRLDSEFQFTEGVLPTFPKTPSKGFRPIAPETSYTELPLCTTFSNPFIRKRKLPHFLLRSSEFLKKETPEVKHQPSDEADKEEGAFLPRTKIMDFSKVEHSDSDSSSESEDDLSGFPSAIFSVAAKQTTDSSVDENPFSLPDITKFSIELDKGIPFCDENRGTRKKADDDLTWLDEFAED